MSDNFYELLDYFKQNKKNNFANLMWSDVFKLKYKFTFNLENKEQEQYYKHVLLKQLNKILLEKGAQK